MNNEDPKQNLEKCQKQLQMAERLYHSLQPRAHKRREGVTSTVLESPACTKNRVLVVAEAFLRMRYACSTHRASHHTYLAKPYEWQEVLYIVTRGRFCCSYSDYGVTRSSPLPPFMRSYYSILRAFGQVIFHPRKDHRI